MLVEEWTVERNAQHTSAFVGGSAFVGLGEPPCDERTDPDLSQVEHDLRSMNTFTALGILVIVELLDRAPLSTGDPAADFDAAWPDA